MVSVLSCFIGGTGYHTKVVTQFESESDQIAYLFANPGSSKHPLKIIVNLDSISHPLTGIGHFSLNLIEELLNHPEVGSLFCNIGSKLKPCPKIIKLFNLIKGEAQKIFLALSEIAQGLKRLLLNNETTFPLYELVWKPPKIIPGR